MKKFKIGSMFAGIGGIDLAFKQAGFDVAWANEIDKYACRTYRMNFGEDSIVEDDVRNIRICDIPDFNVLVAGFPCQAFSSVGLQKGFEDSRGNLFFEIIRILEAKMPKALFLENVANLVKHDDGNTFKVICEHLERLGYHYLHKIMNASDYGIPQQRNRMHLVGFLDERKKASFRFPFVRNLKKTAFDFFDKERQNESYYLDGHKRWDEIVSVVIDSRRIYRFTDWGISKGREGICPTLLAAMGGPYERIPFFRDAYSIRKITQREAARLQGFPDSFVFPIQKTPKQVYKQIGNSVCVPIVREIAIEIGKCLSYK